MCSEIVGLQDTFKQQKLSVQIYVGTYETIYFEEPRQTWTDATSI